MSGPGKGGKISITQPKEINDAFLQAQNRGAGHENLRSHIKNYVWSNLMAASCPNPGYVNKANAPLKEPLTKTTQYHLIIEYCKQANQIYAFPLQNVRSRFMNISIRVLPQALALMKQGIIFPGAMNTLYQKTENPNAKIF